MFCCDHFDVQWTPWVTVMGSSGQPARVFHFLRTWPLCNMVCGGPRRDKSDGLKLTFPDPAPQLAAVAQRHGIMGTPVANNFLFFRPRLDRKYSFSNHAWTSNIFSTISGCGCLLDEPASQWEECIYIRTFATHLPISMFLWYRGAW